MVKVCIKCNNCKDISLFVKNKNSCKDCQKEYKKQYRIKNKNKLSEKDKNYYLINKYSIKKRMKLNYENSKDSKIEYQKKYASLNKEKISEYKIEYQRNRRKNDPVFKLKYSISRSIRNSLKVKKFTKSKKTVEILGCDIEFFKIYMEQKFTNEMNWDNYGKVWDIDHIIPLATAITEEDVIKLNHYTNLQPLDSHINRNIKRDKINY